MSAPTTYAEGTRVLAAADPVIARLLEETGPVSFVAQPESNFVALVRAITYQQLAGAAARAIYARLVALLGDDIVPESVLRHSEVELRSAGLSHAKTLSILDLSAKALDGSITVDDSKLASLTDDEIIAELETVRGIGPWTAQIFVMIHLGRLDVLPSGDLGIRKGYGLAWGVPTPTAKELDALGERFRPYRSVLSWYCWRAAETYGASQASAVTGGV